MKALFLTILVFFYGSLGAQNSSIPQPTGYVNDFAGLFNQAQEDSLTTEIVNYQKKTTNQIAIITITKEMIRNQTIEQYTLSVLNSWGVGRKEKHNGILIGIYPPGRQIRIENGYGIEKVFPDNEAKKIIDKEFIPAFKEGQYFGGTYKGLMAIIRKVPAL